MRQSEINTLPDGFHLADKGLYLKVAGNCRSWVFLKKVDGKQIRRGLGSAYEMPLSVAKTLTEKIRSLIAEGATIDEAIGRALKKEEKRSQTKKETLHSFEAVAEIAIENKLKLAQFKEGTRSEQRLRQTLSVYAYPAFGSKEISEVTTEDVLKALEPIWFDKAPTAKRLRLNIEMVFDFAYVKGWRKARNPAQWKGVLQNFLPSINKVHKEQHLEAPTVEELKLLMQHAFKSEGLSYKGLALGILTGTRDSEFRKATWDEFDLKKAIWTIKGERRKGSHLDDFSIPLPSQAVALLKSIEPKGKYVFSKTGNTPLEINTPRLMLIKFTGRKVTAHGIRSTFSDWCLENGYDKTLVDKALSHVIGDAVAQAYMRTALIEQRRPMMQAWANFICSEVKR